LAEPDEVTESAGVPAIAHAACAPNISDRFVPNATNSALFGAMKSQAVATTRRRHTPSDA